MEGVLFGEKHSFSDWGLILKSRPLVSPPTPKTEYVDVPGSNGCLDMTEVLTGEVVYNRRMIKCEFYIVQKKKQWSDIYSEIADYLHGQHMKIVLDEDPSYYYVGRATINSWESDEAKSIIVINCCVGPYKMDMFSSLEEWEWDSFNFNNGIIRKYKDLTVDGSLELSVVCTRKTVIPTFIVASDDGTGMAVIYEDVEYALKDGTNKILEIKLKQGERKLLFTGIGTVSVEYRGGRL